MATKPEVAKEIRGKISRPVGADWGPLDRLVDAVLADRFVWMHEIELEDGTRLQAYKDFMTGRKLHLDEDGRAFQCTESGRYRQVDLGAALLSVYVDLPAAGRLSKVEEAALRLALAKVEAECAASA